MIFFKFSLIFFDSHKGTPFENSLTFIDYGNHYFFMVFVASGITREAKMHSRLRLEASLKAKMDSKWLLESSLESQMEPKLRLETSMKAQMQSKWRLELLASPSVALWGFSSWAPP